MNKEKQQYLDTLRSNTSYSTYREIIGFHAFFGYSMAGLCALGSIISGAIAMNNSFVTGFSSIIFGSLFSVFVFIATKFLTELATIFVDMGDSVIDSNSKSAIAQKKKI